MHRQTLECRDIVLRALIRPSHIDRQNSRILAAAFILREDEQGLSVDYDCSLKECVSQFNRCLGVASLHVGRVRRLGLDVLPDQHVVLGQPPHANITGLPHPDDDPAEAERFATRLRDQARLVWRK